MAASWSQVLKRAPEGEQQIELRAGSCLCEGQEGEWCPPMFWVGARSRGWREHRFIPTLTRGGDEGL